MNESQLKINNVQDILPELAKTGVTLEEVQSIPVEQLRDAANSYLSQGKHAAALACMFTKEEILGKDNMHLDINDFTFTAHIQRELEIKLNPELAAHIERQMGNTTFTHGAEPRAAIWVEEAKKLEAARNVGNRQ